MAAECQYKGKPVIAMCTDWRAQTGSLDQQDVMIGVDALSKTREFRRATVLLAGNHSRAVELASACKPVIREFTDMDISAEDLDIAVDGFLKNLRQVAATRKAELIQHFVQNSVGLQHSEFVKLPTVEYSDVWNQIRQLNLGADIIITFVSHEPIIVRLDRWGETHWEHNYGVIGNGAEIARAMLCLEMWTPRVHHGVGHHIYERPPLEECLFRLNEAHFAAHKANPSSVGDATTYQVLGSMNRASVTGDFLDRLGLTVAAKHKVPLIEVNESFLVMFQSFATGALSDTEPNEL